jgi:hypothetical protein
VLAEIARRALVFRPELREERFSSSSSPNVLPKSSLLRLIPEARVACLIFPLRDLLLAASLPSESGQPCKKQWRAGLFVGRGESVSASNIVPRRTVFRQAALTGG